MALNPKNAGLPPGGSNGKLPAYNPSVGSSSDGPDMDANLAAANPFVAPGKEQTRKSDPKTQQEAREMARAADGILATTGRVGDQQQGGQQQGKGGGNQMSPAELVSALANINPERAARGVVKKARFAAIPIDSPLKTIGENALAVTYHNESEAGPLRREGFSFPLPGTTNPDLNPNWRAAKDKSKLRPDGPNMRRTVSVPAEGYKLGMPVNYDPNDPAAAVLFTQVQSGFDRAFHNAGMHGFNESRIPSYNKTARQARSKFHRGSTRQA